MHVHKMQTQITCTTLKAFPCLAVKKTADSFAILMSSTIFGEGPFGTHVEFENVDGQVTCFLTLIPQIITISQKAILV